MSRSGQRHIPFSGLIRWAAFLGASLALTDCASRRETVRIPSSDGTPPFVALDAVGAGHTLVLSVGREPEKVDLLPRDSIVLIALSEDADGGIKDISLIGNALVTCKDMKTGQSRIRKTGFMRKTVPGAPRTSHGPLRRSNRFVLRTGDLAALCRGPGMAFAGAVGQATAATTNFNGGHASSPRLEFRLVGGWVPGDPAAAAPAATASSATAASAAAAMSAATAATGASTAGAPLDSQPATAKRQASLGGPALGGPALGGRHGADEPLVVTSEIPKPVGFMAEGGMGGTEYCPKDAFPTPSECIDGSVMDGPVPLLPR